MAESTQFTMKVLQLIAVSVGAVLAPGFLTEVSGADSQTNTTAAKTFRIAGTVVDAAAKPVDVDVRFAVPGAPGLRPPLAPRGSAAGNPGPRP